MSTYFLVTTSLLAPGHQHLGDVGEVLGRQSVPGFDADRQRSLECKPTYRR